MNKDSPVRTPQDILRAKLARNRQHVVDAFKRDAEVAAYKIGIDGQNARRSFSTDINHIFGRSADHFRCGRIRDGKRLIERAVALSAHSRVDSALSEVVLELMNEALVARKLIEARLLIDSIYGPSNKDRLFDVMKPTVLDACLQAAKQGRHSQVAEFAKLARADKDAEFIARATDLDVMERSAKYLEIGYVRSANSELKYASGEDIREDIREALSPSAQLDRQSAKHFGELVAVSTSANASFRALMKAGPKAVIQIERVIESAPVGYSGFQEAVDFVAHWRLAVHPKILVNAIFSAREALSGDGLGVPTSTGHGLI